MKKLNLKMLTLIFIPTFYLITVASSSENKQKDENTRECKKICVKWEERRDCRPNPIPGGTPICASYKVCVEWKEECS